MTKRNLIDNEKKLLRRVTLKDIALRCNVAVITVSLALRGNEDRINRDTAKRIRAVADEMGYDPQYSASARRLVLSRQGKCATNHAVAIMFPLTFTASPYHMAIYHGILTTLFSQGHALINVPPLSREHIDHHDIAAVIRRGEVDALILMASKSETSACVSYLREHPGFAGRPIISLMQPDDGCICIRPDDRQGGVIAAEYLIAHEHRHLAFIRSATTNPQFLTDRQDGIEEVMCRHSLDPSLYLHPYHLMPSVWLDPPSVREESHTALSEGGKEFLAFITAHPEITAIIAWNDVIAWRLWAILEEAGIRIPEDISIIGYDDAPGLTIPQSSGRLISTINVPLYDIGVHAARASIDANPTICLSEVSLPVTLTIRKSTAPALHK